VQIPEPIPDLDDPGFFSWAQTNLYEDHRRLVLDALKLSLQRRRLDRAVLPLVWQCLDDMTDIAEGLLRELKPRHHAVACAAGNELVERCMIHHDLGETMREVFGSLQEWSNLHSYEQEALNHYLAQVTSGPLSVKSDWHLERKAEHDQWHLWAEAYCLAHPEVKFKTTVAKELVKTLYPDLPRADWKAKFNTVRRNIPKPNPA